MRTLVRTFVALSALAFAAPAFGADASAPHPHQGLAPKFTDPKPSDLTPAEEAGLLKGEAVRKQVRYETGGRGIAIQDVHADAAKVWVTILDFPAYPSWIDRLQDCEIYRRDGNDIFVRFDLSVLGMSVEYFIKHKYQPTKGAMTWELDYTRKSDLDDSTGYWLVYPAPGHDGYTRVEYTVDLRLSGWVPGMIEDMLANQGLEKATTWVKKQAEH